MANPRKTANSLGHRRGERRRLHLIQHEIIVVAPDGAQVTDRRLQVEIELIDKPNGRTAWRSQ